MSGNELIVLTGGAGFIGSCFLRELNQAGEKNILVVDHFGEEEKKRNLAGKQFTDLIDKEDFIKKVGKGAEPKKVKAIFHIGACSSTTECDAEYLQRNNYEYSRTLAKWAFTDKIIFQYASSAATYGAGEKGYSDEDNVSLTLKPLNLYGQSKQDFDLWLIKNGLTGRAVGYKYFNVFGPNEYHKQEMRSLVVKAYQQIKKDGVIRLFRSYRPEYRDGEQKRDFVYIKDVTRLMLEFYRRPEIRGIFNIGSGQARSWNDLALAIFLALELKPRIEYIEMPEQIKDKYQYFTEADQSKIKRTGLPVAYRLLEEAVADYVKNYLENGLACI